MARKKSEDEQPKTEASEVSSAQTNPSEQANAPKESTDQQAAQKTIAEGSATVSAGATPTATPSGAAATQQAAQPEPTKPAASSTTADGGVKTTADAPRTDRDKTPQEKADAAKANADAEAAKAAGAEMLKLVVDGVPVEVPKGTLVIEACFRAGADIPYFCYHPRLTSVGACRMCLASVELEMFGQRRASIMTCCTVPAADGMVIKTNTPDVKKAQNGILEFLLANHPLDCPICDRGGECPLQNMTIAYGPPTSRYIEEKRHFPKAMPLSDYVVLDRERCIQCMRCTRFCEEISGDGQLGLINRGAEAEVGTFFGHDFSSNFSGNTIEICPVGALTSRTYRFGGRPWEIKSVDSICGNCGNGCNVAVQTRLGDLVRINGRTNEDINEEWTCDKGKFGQYYVNSDQRLTSPLIRKDGELVEASWEEALRLIADKVNGYKAANGADSIAAIGSTRCTVEENYLLGKLMRAMVGTNNIDHKMVPYPLEPMQTTIAEIEEFKTIVSVGMKLDIEQPIVYLRVYKAKRKKGAEWIQANSLDLSVTSAIAKAGANGVLLLPHTLSANEIAQAKALCQRTGAKMNVLLPDANSWGAPKAGATPHLLPGMKTFDEGRAQVEKLWNATLPGTPGRTTDQILEGAGDGSIKMLYIMGSDPVQNYQDPAFAQKALGGAEFTVVQELFLTETAKMADVVLPAASFAEKDGTFVNIEGREQKIKAALQPRGNSRPDWRILADLMSRLGTPVPYFSARDIYREYTRAIPKADVPAVAAGAAV
jgi:NADH-quinone oxidoreductase subunit G